MDEDIQRLRNDLATQKAREKELGAELAALGGEKPPPIRELQESVSQLTHDRDCILERLSRLRSQSEDPATVVSAAERAQVETDWKVWRKHAGRRRQICRDLWTRCTEVLPEGTTEGDFWVCS
jgi:26S proteasome regulatory subunit, ATPase 3, interacting protein